MRRLAVPLSILLGVYLDSIFFNMVNIAGVRPDVLLAVSASLGVLFGSVKGGLAGLGIGLFMDIVFNKYLGLSAIAYMLTGAVGGIFYQKFYADNVVIPSAVAGALAFVKEHIMALAVIVSGARFDYFRILLLYILPCALFSAVMCAALHLWLKHSTTRQVRIEHRPAKPGHHSSIG